MAKHAAPRTRRSPFWTLLGAGTLACGLTVASLVPLPTVTATAMPSGEVCYDLHGGELCRADQPQEDEPGWDCTTMGNRVCGPQPAACWVEKAHSVYDAEMICGDKGDRPRADTADIGEVFADHDGCSWVITGVPSEDIDGGLEYDPEPAGCN